MFDRFTELVADASGWAYLVVALTALVDAVLPLVPSETVVITAGVVSARGQLNLAAVLILAMAGAFLGDQLGYGLGRWWGPRVRERLARKQKARDKLDWAERQLHERGMLLIVVARFIPGGRTAVTLAAGTLKLSWRRFLLADAIAAALWSGYAGLLGYLGGQVFADAPWKGLLVAFGVALLASGAVEGVRWARSRTDSGGAAAPRPGHVDG
jgi:membrane protein DedA with SNARE-associated domain